MIKQVMNIGKGRDHTEETSVKRILFAAFLINVIIYLGGQLIWFIYPTSTQILVRWLLSVMENSVWAPFEPYEDDISRFLLLTLFSISFCFVLIKLPTRIMRAAIGTLSLFGLTYAILTNTLLSIWPTTAAFFEQMMLPTGFNLWPQILTYCGVLLVAFGPLTRFKSMVGLFLIVAGYVIPLVMIFFE